MRTGVIQPTLQLPAYAATSLRPMDRSIVATTNAFLGQDYWEFFSNPSSSPELVVAMMREMMLEIWFYQRSINESILHAIGRKGRLIDEHPIVQAMLAVQLGNTDDGAIALEDYVTLGGDRDSAINQRPSPSALVLMGTVNYLAEHADPLCCLGCLYFLEKSAEITIAAVEPVLARAGYPRQRLRFLQSHLNKKVSRVSLLVDVIASCEEKYDHAAESIYYGFQCLGQVYPHPLWNSAFQRAVGTDS